MDQYEIKALLDDLVNDYMSDLTQEDEKVTAGTGRQKRIEDFILYTAIRHRVNLLDILHKETLHNEAHN